MIKKCLIVAALLSVSAVMLPSCSDKDEPKAPTVNVESVNGTTWTTVYGHAYTELSFSNGKYMLSGGILGTGTYTQNGATIIFDNGNVLMPFQKTIKSGTISTYGTSMEVVFDNGKYSSNDSPVTVVKFSYDPTR